MTLHLCCLLDCDESVYHKALCFEGCELRLKADVPGSNLRAMHAACAAAVSWAGCGMAARVSGELLQDGQALQAGSILQPHMLHAQQE
jgi:hypothetical protein